MERGFPKAILAGVFVSVLWLNCGCKKPAVQAPRDSAEIQEHIQQMIHSLSPDSEIRGYLERGDRGDGVHYAWMDRMKTLGVKRARIFLDFNWSVWRRHPVDVHFRRIALYQAYDEDCAQIRNPARLHMVEKAGLVRELERFAAKETAKSSWFTIDEKPRVSHGLATVELLDDEWLPPSGLPVTLAPLTGRDQPPPIFIDGDIIHLQEALEKNKFSQDDLDGALFEVSFVLDDPCSIRLLLSAGANPNARNTDGETPLMMAAFAGHLHGAKALVKAGADASIKSMLGETAEELAMKRGYHEIAAAPKQDSRR
jgi:hypothetical protein